MGVSLSFSSVYTGYRPSGEFSVQTLQIHDVTALGKRPSPAARYLSNREFQFKSLLYSAVQSILESKFETTGFNDLHGLIPCISFSISRSMSKP